MNNAFAELAAFMGIEREYTDGTSEHRRASDESVMAALRAMECDLDSPDRAGCELERLRHAESEKVLEPVNVLWRGHHAGIRIRRNALMSPRLECALALENGETRGWTIGTSELGRIDEASSTLVLPSDIPNGIHWIEIACGAVRQRSSIIVADIECFHPDDGRTALGVFLPMHALRSDRNFGIGTLGDLDRLRGWAHDQGVRHVGTLPLLATFLEEPFDPSPYAPVSRSIFGEQFLDFARVASGDGFTSLRTLLNNEAFARDAKSARAGRLVDYRVVWSLARRCLEAVRDDVERSDALAEQVRGFVESDPLIAGYARFRGKDNDSERRLFECAQWLVSEQLSALKKTEGAGLYLDLPIGAHGGGYDFDRDPGLYARGFSLGAPPDALFRGGQSWGFPPRLPCASRGRGHREFVEAVERHMRVASALRIDHAIGLHRCFWVPDGSDATDGVYVREPAEEYYAILSVLSRRHECMVIGENLGTVPPELNDSLASHRILGMRIAQFELGHGENPIPEAGSGNLSALNTHDTPTFAAHWQGMDTDRRVPLGLTTQQDAIAEMESRTEACERVVRFLNERGLLDGPSNKLEDVYRAIISVLGQQRPDAMIINLEDVWGETEPQNVPGIVHGYPNWRRRAALSLEEMMSDPRVVSLLASLRHDTA